MKKRTLSVFAAVLAAIIAIPASLYAAPLNQPQNQPPQEEQQFTSVIDDLPLMPGLKTVEDKDVLFVEPQAGRIAETEATGEVSIDEVYKFYHRSLPHLGWKALDARTYEREGERLRIDARSSGSTTTVQFTVKPLAGN